MSEETCIGYVREALGAADIPVQIENIQRWSATADTAERFSDGRILLAGDAVHVMPPTGGFGGNTGVQDAYDLAWKLAYVLDGTAGPELLDTYDAERRPVGSFAVEQAYTRYVLRLDPSLGTDNLVPIVDEAAVEIGYRYRSRAIFDEPGDDGAWWENPREPTGRPGMRAPHLTVELDGSEISTLDLFGRGFVLIAGSEGSGWYTPHARPGSGWTCRSRPTRSAPTWSTPTADSPGCTASAPPARHSSGRTDSSPGVPTRRRRTTQTMCSALRSHERSGVDSPPAVVQNGLTATTTEGTT